MIRRWLLKKFLKIFHPKDIIQIKRDGSLYIGNKKLEGQNMEVVSEQAFSLRSNKYLKTILDTLRANAENQILYKGESMREIDNNRMVIYVVGQIEKMINLPIGYVEAEKNQEEFVKESNISV